LIESPNAQPLIETLHLLPITAPEQIAPFAVFLASDEAAAVTGGLFTIDSGYMAFKAKLDVMGALQGRTAAE
jgi:enoyl-[acyl-carrier-protein] reductase (NADH)